MAKSKKEEFLLDPPKIRTLDIGIKGTSQYVGNKFGPIAMEALKKKMEEGQGQKKSNKNLPGKDFKKDYEDHMRTDENGIPGIPIAAFRNGMIDACRSVPFKMTVARQCIFLESDGYDPDDGMPIVHFSKGKPESFISFVKIGQTVNLTARPRWRPGWEMRLRIRFDENLLKAKDIMILLRAMGKNIGVGAGRPFSKTSAGLGWGTFVIDLEKPIYLDAKPKNDLKRI